MNEKNNTLSDKAQKAKVIEGMLAELDMSKQELIDLIKAVTEQSISEEKVHEISGGMITQKMLEAGEGISAPISLEELAAHIASGNIEQLEKYLSIEELKNIQIRVGFAFNLKRAIELGITLDTSLVSQMIGVANAERIRFNGKYFANGREQDISRRQAEDAGKSLSALINSRQLARGTNLDQQTSSKLAQVTNDPNSFSNPTASVNVVQRVFSMVRNQLQNAGISPNSTNTTGSSLAAQQQQIQQNVHQSQRIYTQMRRHERRLRNMFPEVGRTRRSGNDLFASVKTKGGEKEVKLKDYLSGQNRLTPKAERLINKINGLTEKLDNSLKNISIGIPEAKAFNFDAAGRLQVKIEESNTQKLVQVVDYLQDIKRDVERLKAKAQDKKQEAAVKKADADKTDTQRMKDLSRGPELDNAAQAAAKIAAEQEASLKFVNMQPHSKELKESKNVEKKESKRMGDELVKLDAMHDKDKMLEAMKASGELKNIESSMKTVMKDMEEAEKNKDLLKEMKLEKKDRFIDKV